MPRRLAGFAALMMGFCVPSSAQDHPHMQESGNLHRSPSSPVLDREKAGGSEPSFGMQRDPHGMEHAVRLSPRTRTAPLPDAAWPAWRPDAIEPFLSEPLVVDAHALATAPRIIAGRDGRVLLARGDRAYVRRSAAAVGSEPSGTGRNFRVFRDATPLKDPVTGEILGYQAQDLGRAVLQRGESATGADDVHAATAMPMTIDIVAAHEEMRAGDRLLPEPPHPFARHVPHAPVQPIAGRIVSVYGHAVQLAGQNQIVAINKGTRDGIEAGHVLAILQHGGTQVDTTGGTKDTVALPDERVGLLMVFRPFEKVSYALVLEISDAARAGDVLVNP